MDLTCKIKDHNCEKDTFIWVSKKNKIIYLENPGVASDFIKENVCKKLDMVMMEYGSLWELKNIDSYFVFSLYYNPIDRLINIYLDWCKGENKSKIDELHKLFKISTQKVVNMTFEDFVNNAYRRTSHVWESQIKYIFYPHLNVELFEYNPDTFKELDKRLKKKLLVLGLHEKHDYPFERIEAVEVNERLLHKLQSMYKLDVDNAYVIPHYLV